MLLIGGIVVVVMFWLVLDGVGGNSQFGVLIVLFVFCVLVVFEVLVLVIGVFQYLGQVMVFVWWILQIIDQQLEVIFVEDEVSLLVQVVLMFWEVIFCYFQQFFFVLENIFLQIVVGEYIVIFGWIGCGKLMLLQLFICVWDLLQGEILFNNQLFFGFSEVILWQVMSVVLQCVYLFSVILCDNLLLVVFEVDDVYFSVIFEKVGFEKLL